MQSKNRRMAYSLTGLVLLAFMILNGGQPSFAQEPPEDLSAGIILAPKAFRAAVKKVVPSLVTIHSFGGVKSAQGKIGGIRRQGEGSTTGVVISSDGYVITSSFNFIQKPPIITLTTQDGKDYLAKPIASDHARKLTLLKITDLQGELTPATFLSPEAVRVGQWAVSVGIGFGDATPALSAGIVSAKNRALGRAIQTDANISPANYGGPLIDIDGKVIGICVPLNPKSNSLGAGVEWYDSGIGFAIPLNDKTLVEKLKQGKDIHRAFLGVAAKAAKLDGSGAKVVSVTKGGPADKAGLKKDDVILKIGSATVMDVPHFTVLVGRFDAQQSTDIVYLRAGKEEKTRVTFGAQRQPTRKGTQGKKKLTIPSVPKKRLPSK